MQGQQFVPLTLLVVDQNGLPTLPAAPPTARIQQDGSSPLTRQTVTLPILDRYGATGLFQYMLSLGTNLFAVGRYHVTYSWAVGSFAGTAEDTFEIVPSPKGDVQGVPIACFWYERPHANFVVFQADGLDPSLFYGRNPSL